MLEGAISEFMSSIVVKNGVVLTPSERRYSNVWIKDGVILGVCRQSPLADTSFEEIDATDCYVTPGLIDLQVNGTSAVNLWDMDIKEEDLKVLGRQMIEHGVTSFLPTLITDSVDNMVEKQRKLGGFASSVGLGKAYCWGNDLSVSRMPGIHLEGPCISESRPGVHPEEFIIPPSKETLQKLVGDNVSLVTIACERDSSGESFKWLEEAGVLVSLGHSNATFEEAQNAFTQGVSMVTHLFNAMPPFHHREPGLVGAALLNGEVSCCLIADGLHLKPEVVELVVKYKGVDRTTLVTDIAHVGTENGGLVGSSITLDKAVQNLVKWQVVDFEGALRMASLNPASLMGFGGKIGSISKGKLADVVLWDKESLAVNKTILAGKVVFSR